MRPMLPAALLLALAAGAASAQPPISAPAATVVCLDVSGAKFAPVCRAPAGRLQPGEDYCHCAVGVMTKASVCPSGVSPPAENVALQAARKTASRDGSLVGDLFEGRPMCEAARLDR